MKSVIKGFSVFLVSLITASPSQAYSDEYGRWTNGVSEPWYFQSPTYTKQEAFAAQERWNLIQEDIDSSSGNEWEGTYKMASGDLNESYLRWSPDLGFVFMDVYTCLPDVSMLNYGRVMASSRLLRLQPEVPIRRPHSGHGSHSLSRFDKIYLPVKWGERHYLVPKRNIAAFYRYVAGLGEYQPNSSVAGRDFFIKIDDQDKPVDDMPILPPGYERYVRKPIDALINAVGDRTIRRLRAGDGSIYYESVTPVVLNAGRVNGIKRGMHLYVVGSKRMETVEITRVRNYSSTGIIVRSLDDNQEENYKDWDTGERKSYPEIKVGWQLTTSWHKSN